MSCSPQQTTNLQQSPSQALSPVRKTEMPSPQQETNNQQQQSKQQQYQLPNQQPQQNFDHSYNSPQKRFCKSLTGTSYVIPSNSQLVGRGSFGIVYRVYDLTRPSEDLAVKIINKELVQRGNDVLIEKEIEIIENLPDCVNLVKYERYCLKSKNNYYFIMEYCNGGDLRSLMTYRRTRSFEIFSEAETVDFLGQILNGYRQLLNHGIIHRDIKPQNILLNNGMYKLADFGLSKRIVIPQKQQQQEEKQVFESFFEELELSMIPGTPMYQAPDVHAQSKYTEAIDVFSLGVILFQLLFENANEVIAVQEQRQLSQQQKLSDSKNSLPQPKTVPQEKPKQAKAIHPLFDMANVRSKDDFFGKLLQLNQESAVEYLNEYLSKSRICRSQEIIELMKSMLVIDPKKRVTFQQLFSHRLIKPYLQNPDTAFQQTRRHQDIKETSSKVQNQREQDSAARMQLLQGDLFQSEIINLNDVKSSILEANISICKELYESNSAFQVDSNDYYKRKMDFYTSLRVKEKADLPQSSGLLPANPQQQSDNLLGDKLSVRGILFEVGEINTKVAQNKLESGEMNRNASGDSAKENVNQQLPENGESKNEKDQRDETLSPRRKEEEIQGMVVQSNYRNSVRNKSKKIEDILLFLRESGLIYRKAVNELGLSYGMMALYDQEQRSDFVRLFDEVSLLSLFMYRSELSRIRNNINTILLDNSVGLQEESNNGGSGGYCAWGHLKFNDGDFEVFKTSNEYALFLRQIEGDFSELNNLFNTLNESNPAFKQLFTSYSNAITSQVDIKQSFADQILRLIKRGVEEFGLIESEMQMKKFQRTLLILVELDQLSRNPITYYQKYSYSSANLQYKWEQIRLSNDLSQQLADYCYNSGIPLIAQAD